MANQNQFKNYFLVQELLDERKRTERKSLPIHLIENRKKDVIACHQIQMTSHLPYNYIPQN